MCSCSDKWDTAINIGHACSLLNDEMAQLEVQMPRSSDHPFVMSLKGAPRAQRESAERHFVHEMIKHLVERSRQLVSVSSLFLDVSAGFLFCLPHSHSSPLLPTRWTSHTV